MGLIKQYEIETENGLRYWYGDDEEHVREQHEEAFTNYDDLGEDIISVRFIKLLDETEISSL